MIDTHASDRGLRAPSDSRELAPFTIEHLPWEPHRGPTWGVTKAIGALIVGVGLASVSAFVIFDRVGLPTPDGVPQLEPQAAHVAEAPIDEPARIDEAAELVDVPLKVATALPVPAARAVILATAVPRAKAAAVGPGKRVRGQAARAAVIPAPRAAFVAVAPSEASSEVAPSEEEVAMPYEAAPAEAATAEAAPAEAPATDWIPADEEPGKKERFVPSDL